MAKTVLGLFDDVNEARDVVRELVEAGFDRKDISMVANNAENDPVTYDGNGDASGTETGLGVGAVVGGIGGLLVGLGAFAIPGVGPVIGAGWLVSTLVGAGVGAAAGGLIGALTDAGVPEEEAHYYTEGVRRGGTLVAVNANDDTADEAARIMSSHGAVDISKRGEQYRARGYRGYNADAQPYTSNESAREREAYRNERDGENEIAVPVVQEELQVGKREVERGVRIYSRVTERPVEETVRLREEEINVERRPADRPVNEGDLGKFGEGVIEISETDEVPVVAKGARVVEEVVVNKETEERAETVRDTVRRADVEVERLGAEKGRSRGSSSS